MTHRFPTSRLHTLPFLTRRIRATIVPRTFCMVRRFQMLHLPSIDGSSMHRTPESPDRSCGIRLRAAFSCKRPPFLRAILLTVRQLHQIGALSRQLTIASAPPAVPLPVFQCRRPLPIQRGLQSKRSSRFMLGSELSVSYAAVLWYPTDSICH